MTGCGGGVAQDIDFSRSESSVILGVEVPVMPQAQLVAYKRALGREVDRLDLEELG